MFRSLDSRPNPLPIPARPVPGTLVGAFEFVVFGVSMLLFTTDRLLTTSWQPAIREVEGVALLREGGVRELPLAVVVAERVART